MHSRYKNIDGLERLLADALPAECIGRNIPLAPLSRWKIGGPAALYVEPETSQQAAVVMSIMSGRDEPMFVMGDASNTLFDSAGFNGVVMRIGRRMSQVRIRGNEVWAQAGVWVPKLARTVGCAGLSGIEHTIGIPGTLGGLIMMNGGSQRKGIGMSVQTVKCVSREGKPFQLNNEECGFTYRTSSLQTMHAVVLEATLELEYGDPASIRR